MSPQRRQYSAQVAARAAVIAENRSRRMRRNPLPPLPVPPKPQPPMGFAVTAADGTYLGFVHVADLAEARAEVAEWCNPDECTFTAEESFA